VSRALDRVEGRRPISGASYILRLDALAEEFTAARLPSARGCGLDRLGQERRVMTFLFP
jgi:hypothetical protein